MTFLSHLMCKYVPEHISHGLQSPHPGQVPRLQSCSSVHTSAAYEQSGRSRVCFPSPHVTLHSAHDAQSSNGADVTSLVVIGGAVVVGGSLVLNGAVVDKSVVTSGKVDG